MITLNEFSNMRFIVGEIIDTLREEKAFSPLAERLLTHYEIDTHKIRDNPQTLPSAKFLCRELIEVIHEAIDLNNSYRDNVVPFQARKNHP